MFLTFVDLLSNEFMLRWIPLTMMWITGLRPTPLFQLLDQLHTITRRLLVQRTFACFIQHLYISTAFSRIQMPPENDLPAGPADHGGEATQTVTKQEKRVASRKRKATFDRSDFILPFQSNS